MLCIQLSAGGVIPLLSIRRVLGQKSSLLQRIFQNIFQIEQAPANRAAHPADPHALGLGNFFALGEQVHRLLQAQGIQATLVNPRYISGIDTELLDNLAADHRLVVTLEDGALEGGFGEKIARHYGPTAVKTHCYGARKTFVDRYSPQDFLAANRLVDTMIAEDVVRLLG